MTRSFSDFFRNATLEEKLEVFREVAEKANEEQRRVVDNPPAKE